MALGFSQIDTEGTWVMLVIGDLANLGAVGIQANVMKNLRKGFRPSFAKSVCLWIYDVGLLIISLILQPFMFNNPVAPEATVMFYANLLSFIIHLQTIAVTGIISNSIFANLVTGFQYRGFVETLRHALSYHTPELNCKESLMEEKQYQPMNPAF